MSEPKLLIVEDDEPIRKLLCESFTRSQIECDTARDGAEAIEMIQQRPYSVILLDLMMPTVDGFEVIRFVRRLHLEPQPMIFVVSAFADALPEKLDPDVVAMVVRKPFDIGDLSAIVTQTIAGLERMSQGSIPSERAGEKTGADSGAQVLVVDDDLPLRNLIVAALQREKLPLETAANGEEAIQTLSGHRFRVLVLDLMMPKVSGWDVIQWLKQHPEHLPYTVLVITAADRSVLHELDPDVVNAILVKPFDVFDLAGYVRACCGTPAMRDRRRKRVVGVP